MQHILPYGHGPRDPFSVEVEGEHPPTRETIATALPTQYERMDLDGAVRDFFGNLAYRFALCETAAFELCFISDSGARENRPTGFRLPAIQPGSLDTLNGDPIQFVPDDYPHDGRRGALAYVRLDPASVVMFNPPTDVAAYLRRAVSFLAAAGGRMGVDLELMQDAQRNDYPFDFGAYRNEFEDLLTDATAPIGWNARREIVGYQRLLEPYTIYRQVRFLELKVRLRETMLAGLNDALSRAGSRLGFDGRVVIKGLASPADVTAAKSDLRDGTRSLRDLVDFALRG